MMSSVLILFVGFIGCLLFRFSGDIGNIFFNSKGEGDAGGDAGGASGDAGKGGAKGTQTFTQSDVDRIVQDRIARERQKYGDYDDLRKFKTEYEQQQDKIKQDELIKQRKYEEAEAGYKKQLGEIQNVVGAKDAEIRRLTITHNLSNEISKSNGYVEESIALLLKDADVDKNGNVIIKGKDTNGIDVNLSVAEGVKKFLDARPHLVRSTHQKGGGTGSGDGNGTGGNNAGGTGGVEDLNSLNRQLVDAMNRGDRKKTSELKIKIREIAGSKTAHI